MPASNESLPVLSIVICSTRPGRVGKPVADWFIERAQKHGHFDVRVLDMLQVKLPFVDEPNHPRFQNYTHEHTKKWSRTIAGTDAFVFVIPEYNFSMNAVFKNAMDYLQVEWAYKAVGWVSYGGISAGTRSMEQTKQVTTSLRMYSVLPVVSIPFVAQFVNDNGEIDANDVMNTAADDMLAELAKVNGALSVLRE